MSRRVGVDIGTSNVRVVEVNGVDREGLAQVTKAAIAPMPPGAVAGGRVQDSAQVAFAVRRAMREARVSAHGVVLGIASPDAALATVNMLGAVARTEWANVLRLENTPISPKVPMMDSALSLTRMNTIDREDGTSTHTLLAAATLRSEVDALMDVCRRARLTPRAIDLAGAAAFRGLVRVAQDDQGVSTLVDIGASKVTIATRQGQHLRSVRTVATGGEKITRAIMGVMSCSFEDAETRKRAMRVGLPAAAPARSALAAVIGSTYGTVEDTKLHDEDTSDVVQEALTTSADQLVEDIAGAVEQDSFKHPDAPSQAVVLCGGGALLQGLPERLQTRIGVPTFIGRPWVTVAPSPRTQALYVDGVPDPAAVLEMASAVGLALWKEND